MKKILQYFIKNLRIFHFDLMVNWFHCGIEHWRYVTECKITIKISCGEVHSGYKMPCGSLMN